MEVDVTEMGPSTRTVGSPERESPGSMDLPGDGIVESPTRKGSGAPRPR